MSPNSSETSDTGYVRVTTTGFVRPGLVADLMSGLEGAVLENGVIEIKDTSDKSLSLVDSDSIEPGTGVYITRFRGMEWAIPLREYQRKQWEKKAEKHLEARKRRKEKNRKRTEAEAFWELYDIPFKHDVGIKGRLSGLTRGSSGNGRASNTVNHLFVKEAFEDGRLSRPADSFLCSPGGSWPFDHERFLDGDGNEYVPEVTCKQCLKFMKRWQTSE